MPKVSNEKSTEYYYQQMISKKEYQENPYTFIVNDLINRGTGLCLSDDGKREMAMKALGNFDEVVNKEFITDLAEKRFSKEPNHEKIMDCFKKSLEIKEFNMYFDAGRKQCREDWLATSLNIFRDSKNLRLYSTSACNGDE
ncbi:MAG: hypothetical protein VX777_05235 [Chlamydiota bacterium]|nr:hypothetical protein [Chlamydiota bacterium]